MHGVDLKRRWECVQVIKAKVQKRSVRVWFGGNSVWPSRASGGRGETSCVQRGQAWRRKGKKGERKWTEDDLQSL